MNPIDRSSHNPLHNPSIAHAAADQSGSLLDRIRALGQAVLAETPAAAEEMEIAKRAATAAGIAPGTLEAFCGAIRGQELVRALKIAEDPVVFRVIKTHQAAWKTLEKAFIDEFFACKTALDELTAMMQQPERYTLLEVIEKTRNDMAEPVVRYFEEALELISGQPLFRNDCMLHIVAMQRIKKWLREGSLDHISKIQKALEMLQPAMSADFLIRLKQEHQGNPAVLTHLQIAETFPPEAIVAALHLYAILRYPEPSSRDTQFQLCAPEFRLPSDVQAMHKVIALLAPNSAHFAPSEIERVLKRIADFQALYEKLFPFPSGLDEEAKATQIATWLQDRAFMEKAIRITLEADDKVAQDLFHLPRAWQANQLKRALQAVRELENDCLDDIDCAVYRSMHVEERHVLEIALTVIHQRHSLSQKVKIAIFHIREFNGQFFADTPLALLALVFHDSPALERRLTNLIAHLPHIKERAEKAHFFVLSMKQLRRAFQEKSKEAAITAALELVENDPLYEGLLPEIFQKIVEHDHLPPVEEWGKEIQHFLSHIFTPRGTSELLKLFFAYAPHTETGIRELCNFIDNLKEEFDEDGPITKQLRRMQQLLTIIQDLRDDMLSDENIGSFIDRGIDSALNLGLDAFDAIITYLKKHIPLTPQIQPHFEEMLRSVRERVGRVFQLLELCRDCDDHGALALFDSEKISKLLFELLMAEGISRSMNLVLHIFMLLDEQLASKLHLAEQFAQQLASPAAFRLPANATVEEENERIHQLFNLQSTLFHHANVMRTLLRKDVMEMPADIYAEKFAAVKKQQPKRLQEIDQLHIALHYDLNLTHLQRGITPLQIPEAIPEIKVAALVDLFKEAGFNDTELKVACQSDFPESYARQELRALIKRMTRFEIQAKRGAEGLPLLEEIPLQNELQRALPEELLAQRVQERMGSYYPKQHIQDALQQFVTKLEKKDVALSPRGVNQEKWYKDTHAMLTHIIHKLQSAPKQAVKNCLLEIIKASGHCAVGIDEAIIRCYRIYVLNQPVPVVEGLYESLANYRALVGESLMAPPGMRESVMFYAKLQKALGKELGLPNAERYAATEATAYSEAGNVDLEREQARFFGFYNPRAVIAYLIHEINDTKAKKEFCLSCIPKGWKRPAGMEYEAIKNEIEAWQKAEIKPEDIVERLHDPKYDIWIQKKDLAAVDDAIDAIRKGDYMASVTGADGKISFQGVANMLEELGVFVTHQHRPPFSPLPGALVGMMGPE